MSKSGRAGLLLWCQNVTRGYPNVEVKDFHKSWRDGLALCAIIHKFHPEALNFASLDQKNMLENNELAIRTCESLGIPALIDAEDMIIDQPEQFSVITYLAQVYNVFEKGISANPTGALTPAPNQPPSGAAPVKAQNTGTTRQPNCVACSTPLSGSVAEWNGSFYHNNCFSCTNCKVPFNGKEATKLGENPYCSNCAPGAFMKMKQGTQQDRPQTQVSASQLLRMQKQQAQKPAQISQPQTPTPVRSAHEQTTGKRISVAERLKQMESQQQPVAPAPKVVSPKLVTEQPLQTPVVQEQALSPVVLQEEPVVEETITLSFKPPVRTGARTELISPKGTKSSSGKKQELQAKIQQQEQQIKEKQLQIDALTTRQTKFQEEEQSFQRQRNQFEASIADLNKKLSENQRLSSQQKQQADEQISKLKQELQQLQSTQSTQNTQRTVQQKELQSLQESNRTLQNKQQQDQLELQRLSSLYQEALAQSQSLQLAQTRTEKEHLTAIANKQAQYASLEAEKEKLVAQWMDKNQLLSSQINQLSQQKTNLEADKETLSRNMQSTNQKLRELEQEKRKAEALIKHLQLSQSSQSSALEQEQNKRDEQEQSWIAQKDQLIRQQSARSLEVESLQKDLDEKLSQFRGLQQQVNTLQSANQQKEQQVQFQQQQLASKEHQIQQLKDSVQDSQQEATAKRLELFGQNSKLTAELLVLKDTHQQAQSKNNQLELAIKQKEQQLKSSEADWEQRLLEREQKYEKEIALLKEKQQKKKSRQLTESDSSARLLEEEKAELDAQREAQNRQFEAKMAKFEEERAKFEKMQIQFEVQQEMLQDQQKKLERDKLNFEALVQEFEDQPTQFIEAEQTGTDEASSWGSSSDGEGVDWGPSDSEANSEEETDSDPPAPVVTGPRRQTASFATGGWLQNAKSGTIVHAQPILSERDLRELEAMQAKPSVMDFDKYVNALSGWLNKKDESSWSLNPYKQKWFKLSDSRLFFYPKQPEQGKKAQAPEGIIPLQLALLIEAEGQYYIKIHFPERVYELQAESLKERDKWITELKNAQEIYAKLKNHVGGGQFGQLVKKDDLRKEGVVDVSYFFGWSTMYFVLVDGILFVYNKQGGTRQHTIPLYHSTFEAVQGSKGRYTFQIKSPEAGRKELLCSTSTEQDTMKWLTAMLKQRLLIEEVIDGLVF